MRRRTPAHRPPVKGKLLQHPCKADKSIKFYVNAKKSLIKLHVNLLVLLGLVLPTPGH